MSDTPQSLLARLQQQPTDGASWQRLVELYTPFLHHWLLRQSSLAQQDREDIVQNVLTVVVRRLPQFQHSGRAGAFRRWLREIVVNCLRDARRKSPPEATGDSDFLRLLHELEAPESGLSRVFEEEHDQHILKRLLATAQAACSPHDFAVFERVFLRTQEPAQVAAELRMSLSAVYSAKSRVLAWLRREASGLVDD